MERPLTIGQLAHATGVPAKTIRYYEQIGVLPAPRRSAAGYRHYSRHAVHRLLFMRRNLHEVIASQNKMLERRGETSETEDERMIELYRSHLRRVSALLRHGPHFRWIDLQYTAVLESPRAEAERIRRFLGRDLDLERMAAVVDESLYRNRAEARSARGG